MFKTQLKFFGMLCFVAILCSGSIFKKKYFEGKLYYSVAYKANFNEADLKKIQNIRGTQRHDIYKEGNKLMIFKNDQEDTVRKILIDMEKGEYVIWVPNYDTLYNFDLKKKSYVLNVRDNKDTLINGRKHELLDLGSYNSETYAVESWHLRSVLSKKLKVNPDWYKNYKEGGFDKFVESYPYISVCDIEYMDASIAGYSITTKLDSVERRSVRKNEIFINFSDSLVRKRDF